MAHKLYAIHGSHPCATAERALQLAGLPYRVVELPPGLHVAAQWLRFRRRTVPALVLGSGEAIVGSRAIVHRLHELAPDAGLLPDDPAARERVLTAERWGDEVLQAVVRRLFWVGMARAPRAADRYAEGSRLPLPPIARRAALPFVRRQLGWLNGATPAAARADIAALPAQLDAIDGWIADGVIGGPRPNAADLQLASSLRMLATFADVRPLLDGRPCDALARRVFPDYPGALPAGALGPELAAAAA